jgi:predicted metal-dependent phosphoesterase TrpH
MKIDLHCHSKYSYDTYLEPQDIIEEAVSKGLNGVCFTEHHSITASLPIEALKVPKGFYVFRGMEVSTTSGHLLVYGLHDDAWNVWSRNHYLDVEKVMTNVHKLGGICIAAHPFREYDSFRIKALSLKGLDAVETHNGLNSQQENDQALMAAMERHLPSIGGSDCHIKNRVGAAYTEFKKAIRSMEELIREIRNGNCKGCLLNL